MSVRPPVWPIALNEARALVSSWIACVLAAVAATLAAGATRPVSLFALAAVGVGLGAQSIGHEYAHGTLSLTLTLPVARRRIFVVKIAVLGAMLLPLAGYAWWMTLVPSMPAMPWLTAAAALCLAPAMTMLSRSQIAGAILALAVPGMVITAVRLLLNGTLGSVSAETDNAVLAIWFRLMLVLLAAGAALSWWLFMRLEAIGGDAAQIDLKWSARTAEPSAPRHPLWQLLRKELRLQQLAFAVTALFALTAWPVAMLFRDAMNDEAFFAGASVSWLGLPLLVGSLASAGERQLGTLSWQLLLPIPAWQQWAAKVAVVVGLSLLLTVGAPLPILHFVWPGAPVVKMSTIALVVTLSAGSLYVSSLCLTGVRAAVASFALIPMILWVVGWIGFALSAEPVPHPAYGGAALTILMVIWVLLVGFAFENHRSELPARARIRRQVLALAAVAAFALGAFASARF